MSEIGSTRSLDRTARSEDIAPARDGDKDKAKASTLSALDKRSVSGAEVGQARASGSSDSSLAPPPPSKQLTAKTTADEGGSARLSGNTGNKIASEYSTLQQVGKSGADGIYSVLNAKDIAPNTAQARKGDENYANTQDLRSPPVKVDSGHYEVSPNAIAPNAISPNAAGRGAANTVSNKTAPPLPLRAGDFLPSGGIDTLALKGRFMREGAYLARSPSTASVGSTTMGVRIFDRRAIAGKPRVPRFTAAKKLFSAIKNLFSRRASVVPRDISSEKSRFSNEIAARGKAQGLGKQDQKQVARLSKDMDSIINKGRSRDGITAKQHADVFAKNSAINIIFAEDAKRQGIKDDFADPIYASVEGDYARLRNET